MIKEYAVEPEFLTLENIFPFIFSSFGFTKGRVISKFPKKWLKMVWEAFDDLPPRKKKLVEVGLEKIKKNKLLVTSHRDYNNELTWLENAILQQKIKPFHAVLSNQEKTSHEFILSLDDLSQEHPLFFENQSGKIITRSAQQIAHEIYCLAKFSNKLILVDPYLTYLRDRQVRPLDILLRKIVQNNLKMEIELHISDKEFDENYFLKRLSQVVPDSLPIAVIIWPSNEMHNRYALTENGGILFGTGLDDNESGERTNEDDLVLLDNDQHRKWWEHYNNSPNSKIEINVRN